MLKDSVIIKQLEAIAETLPTPVYWIDTHSRLLGANAQALKAIGATCLSEVIGKTPYDFYSQSLAEPIVKHNEEVMKKGLPLSQEESIRDIQTGKIRYYRASKSPLRDVAGKVIGMVGSSTEITEEKEAEALKLETLKKAQVLKYLELLAPLFPILVYWNDVDSVVLGANQHTLSGVGANASLKGKSPYDMYPREIAERIVKHNNEVMRTGQILWQEEPIKDMTTGRMRYYSAFKAPLRDEDGKIIGTLGISIETTAEKESELFKLENERHQIALQESEKFAQLARKVAHDISSPLAALKMMLPSCTELPENKRTMLNRATEGILDIANNLLSNYHKQKSDPTEIEPRQHLLVSDLLIQLLSEKKMQYRNSPVTLETVIANDAHFAFIRMQAIEFRRSMSNLINNAVDALEDNINGKVTIQLMVDTNAVIVEI